MKNFFKYNVKLNVNPRRTIAALIRFTVITIVLVLGTYPILAAVILGAVIGLMRYVDLQINDVQNERVSLLFWIAAPLLSLYLVEYLNDNVLFLDVSALQILLNLVFYYIVAFIFLLIFGRNYVSADATAIFFFCLGCANHYVIHFRGRSIFPVDFLVLDSAGEVALSYDYTPCFQQATALLILMIFIAIAGLFPRQGRRKLRLKRTAAAVASAILYNIVFFFTPFTEVIGIEPSLWTTRGNGFVLNFSVCIKYSRIDKPEGYSAEAAREIADVQGTASKNAPNSFDSAENIIVIMDESFADLQADGNLTISSDDMPFYHSLSENTIKGYLYSSVFAGTTANSEYEFLTNNTMAFLPAGSVPYQLLVEPGDSSLVSQLNSLGYTTIAMHPYKDNGWNRRTVYPDFGFDTMLFQDDIQNPEYVRDYIGDLCDFKNIIRLYEEKTAGSKWFLFNVTMQNHSPYNLSWNNLTRSVHLTGNLSGDSLADQYLSLIHETDASLEYLIDYFQNIDEKTIIVFFGDHQPMLSTSFYEKLMGKGLTEQDALTKESQYETVYFIWANYDIPEIENYNISINYLSVLMAEYANIPMTGYQSFLADLMKNVPVIHATGYWTDDGSYYENTDQLPDPEKQLVQNYSILQYNQLKDRDNKIEGFFDLD